MRPVHWSRLLVFFLRNLAAEDHVVAAVGGVCFFGVRWYYIVCILCSCRPIHLSWVLWCHLKSVIPYLPIYRSFGLNCCNNMPKPKN
ncbi:hypothetical protein F4810DRAFT_271504 [Camillea tinctor]|nr:hypothetical protein F4810DRAFT_271504 [Camillea tinctor]